MKCKVFEKQILTFRIGGEEKMASGRLMKFVNLFFLVVVFTIISASNADIATFEDLSLPAESYWNGSDESGGFVRYHNNRNGSSV